MEYCRNLSTYPRIHYSIVPVSRFRFFPSRVPTSVYWYTDASAAEYSHPPDHELPNPET